MVWKGFPAFPAYLRMIIPSKEIPGLISFRMDWLDLLAIKAFQTMQGNRHSCRDQEGRRGSDEVVSGPSVFPSGEPGVSGDFWGSEANC